MKHLPAVALVVSLLFSPAALAQREVTVTATANKSAVVEAERVTITATVTNTSTAAVRDLRVTIGFTRGLLFVEATGPGGWNCTADFSAQCTGATLAPGESVQIVATGYAALFFPFEPAPRAHVNVQWIGADGRLASAAGVVPFTLSRAPTRADITVTGDATALIRLNETATAGYDVRNNGPADAARVWLRVSTVGGNGTVSVAGVSGAGWNCSTAAAGVNCHRDLLRSGESAPIDVQFTAPAQPGYSTAYVHAFAEERHDPAPHDNGRSVFVSFANAEHYERVLIPIVASQEIGVPGAGARWITELQGYIDSDEPVELIVECTGPIMCGIPTPPRRKPFDAQQLFLVDTEPRGVFLAFRRSETPRFRFNLRVRDLTRSSETWGTELPVVREHEFQSDKIVLMPLPVGAAFRHTLRVYSDGNAADARVVIRVFSRGDDEPRATIVRTLEQQSGHTTRALLPRYPGYTQLDPVAEANLSGADDAWVEIESLTPGLRFWAFATVTNNVTSHVTTITPQ